MLTDDFVKILQDPIVERHPELLFERVPEIEIWQNAHILSNSSDYISIILRAIGESFTDLSIPIAAENLVFSVLKQPLDDFIYRDAQRVILKLASRWSDVTVKEFLSVFKHDYRGYNERRLDKNVFIAQIALEGAVTLVLQRGNRNLFYSVLDLLLNEFPSLPEDPEDSALLPVKALKLLGRCYDFSPQTTEIPEMIEKCISVSNNAVKAEASFNLGIVHLYNAFRAEDIRELQDSLSRVLNLFNSSAALEEERSDAILFSEIVNCYLQAMIFDDVNAITDSLRRAQEILLERCLFSGYLSADSINIEIRLVQLAEYLGRWVEQLLSITKQPNLIPPLQLLAGTYAAIRQFRANSDTLTSGIYEGAQNLIMLQQIHSQFIQLQEARAKLLMIMNNSDWGESTSSAEKEFYESLLSTLNQVEIPPKVVAAADPHFMRLRAAATYNHTLVELMDLQLAEGRSIEEITLEIVERLSEEHHLLAEFIYSSFGTNQDLYVALLQEIQRETNLSSKEQIYLKHTLALITHYAFDLFCADFSEEYSFLFASNVKAGRVAGKGQLATEKDLQNHFYQRNRNAAFVKVRREAKEDISGRVDLLLQYHTGVSFPIEVKRELEDIGRKSIENSYLTQTQHYTAATTPVGFLFVLDATSKAIDQSPLAFRDYIYAITRKNNENESPLCVVVVVFYANRYRPSDHSWRRHSE